MTKIHLATTNYLHSYLPQRSVPQAHSLKETISSIQQIQKEQNIQSFAATLSVMECIDLNIPVDPGCRAGTAYSVGKKSPVDWDDFWYLDNQLWREYHHGNPKVVTAITWAMFNMACNISYPSLHRYSKSNLMRVANGTYSQIGVFDRKCETEAKINAASALRIIMEKIGNQVDDEREIIKTLLNSSLHAVREQGLLAAQNTYKHKWRKDVINSGLVKILRIEADQRLRNIAAWTIAHAGPQVLLVECQRSEDDTMYYPVDLLEVIESTKIKTNLIWGLCNLVYAQERRGKYYDDFYEIPALTELGIEKCLKHSLAVIYDLNSRSSLSEDERLLLSNACSLLERLLNKWIVTPDNTLTLDRYTFHRLHLSNIDMKQFIKHATVSDIWDTAARIIEVALNEKGKRSNQALSAFLLLRSEIMDMKTAQSERQLVSNLNNVITIVDRCIVTFLCKRETTDIAWGKKDEFNQTFSRLLTLISTTTNKDFKYAAISLIDNLRNEGVVLSDKDKGVYQFNSIVSTENKAFLFSILRNNIYSEPTTCDVFTRPSVRTSQGRALLLLRRLTTSFKDYYGLSRVKQEVLRAASEAIAGKKFVKGFILSGVNGTGKSFFAGALAGELGLPLQMLKGTQIDHKKLGQICTRNPTTLEEYFEILKQSAPLVLLLDEIQAVAPAEGTELTERFVKCLQGLQTADVPVIMIGTTNEPEPVLIEGLPISENGLSGEIDKVMERRIHPYCLEVMNGCYPFHQLSLGVEFTTDYLTDLYCTGKLKGDLDIEKVSVYASGLKPPDILKIAEASLLPSDGVYLSEAIAMGIEELYNSNRETKIQELAKLIESGIRYYTLKPEYKMEGAIDYELLANAAEHLSVKDMGRLLGNIPHEITQESLMVLFNSALGGK